MISGEGHGKPADWWSLGVLVYEMLYGMPPFYNRNQNMMFQLISESEVRFPPNPQISPEAKDLIIGLLKKHPRQRLATAKDFLDIKAMPWFKEIDWEEMEKLKLPTPFKPDIDEETWTKNFDKEFIAEDPINSYHPNTNLTLINEFSEDFKEFDLKK